MVWPETGIQRCWNHAIVNCLDKLPKSQQRAAQLLLCAMPYAPTRAESARLRDGFARRYANYPEAVAVLERDWETLSTFYDFPAEHWKHLRTSNVVESPFAALRLRTGAARRFKVVANATMHLARAPRGRAALPQARRAGTPEGRLRGEEVRGRQAHHASDREGSCLISVYTLLDVSSTAWHPSVLRIVC